MGAPARSARQLFVEEARRPEEDLDLARAALLVAREEYPQLPVERYLGRLDQLAEEVKDRLDEETAPPVVLQEVRRTLFDRHGLRGNKEAYYDPRNSFLNDVLDRGLGIPLTLGIILLEVGWRLGLPLEGVDFPHHFLVRFRGDALNLLVDAFDGGRTRFHDEAQGLLDRVYGGTVRLREDFLRTASRRDMLVRMLRNLKGIYINARDDRRALGAVERILLLRPDLPSERRTRGMLLGRLGRTEEAVEELLTYLEEVPEARDAQRVRMLVRRLRAGEAVDDEVSGAG
ncbi:MAG TPA: transglutaminase-like domain-containing protein [Longimicrobiales bacterium]|nr:transglutaminase-like domain-containing protein [Longimicrobiales bacterium]